jgi:hypothetical protein
MLCYPAVCVYLGLLPASTYIAAQIKVVLLDVVSFAVSAVRLI